jgi:hypothetical protein
MLATECDTYDGNLRDLSLQMLRPLGGSVGVNYFCHDTLASSIQEIQTVFVSCAMKSWVALFGEPQAVRLHFDPPSAQWQYSWEQHLPGGLVHCLGYIFERSPGVNWVIVKQFRVSCHPVGASVTGPVCRREWARNPGFSNRSRLLGGQS